MNNKIDNMNELLEKIQINKSVLPKFIDNIYHILIHLPSNIKKWWSVIINDRDWDYDFLIEIIEIKLRAMIKSFEKYGDTENIKNEIYEMKILLKAFEKLRSMCVSDYKNYNDYKIDKSKTIDIISNSFKNIENWWY